MNPPLREADDQDALWDSLRDGTLDTVASDHVGRLRETKAGSIWSASAGFPGIPTILPALIQEGHHKRQLPLERIAELTALHPGRIFGVGGRKGDIRAGFDADLAIVDLDWERTPNAAELGTFSNYSLYEDRPLRGWPRYAFSRGRLIQQDGAFTDSLSSALSPSTAFEPSGGELTFAESSTGTILDTDAVALLGCRVINDIKARDHQVFIGRVETLE